MSSRAAGGAGADAPKDVTPGSAVLESLWDTVASRRGGDPAESYSASLLARFPEKPAQKLAEEAAECVIEAVARRPDALVRESADLLFHLVVLLVGSGITLDPVFAELRARERTATARRRKAGQASRRTTKIP